MQYQNEISNQLIKIIKLKKPYLKESDLKQLNFVQHIKQLKVFSIKQKSYFEQELNENICSYILAFHGDLSLQLYEENKEGEYQLTKQTYFIKDEPFYLGLTYQSTINKKYKLYTKTGVDITFIKEFRINQLLNRYYSQFEWQSLESMKNVYFLSDQSYTFISSLLHQSQKIEFIKNQNIYEQGDIVDSWYLLLSGEVVIQYQIKISSRQNGQSHSNEQSNLFNQSNGKKKKLSKRLIQIKVVGRNECFGEIEILQEREFRENQARCISLSCIVLEIQKDVFLKEFQNQKKDKNYSILEVEKQFSIQLKQKSKHIENSLNNFKHIHQSYQSITKSLNTSQENGIGLFPDTQKKKKIYLQKISNKQLEQQLNILDSRKNELTKLDGQKNNSLEKLFIQSSKKYQKQKKRSQSVESIKDSFQKCKQRKVKYVSQKELLMGTLQKIRLMGGNNKIERCSSCMLIVDEQDKQKYKQHDESMIKLKAYFSRNKEEF